MGNEFSKLFKIGKNKQKTQKSDSKKHSNPNATVPKIAGDEHRKNSLNTKIGDKDKDLKLPLKNEESKILNKKLPLKDEKKENLKENGDRKSDQRNNQTQRQVKKVYRIRKEHRNLSQMESIKSNGMSRFGNI